MVERWQDKAAVAGLMDEPRPVKRSGIGGADNRLDGLSDLLLRAPGASVIDIGCNRGHVAFEFYRAGARMVHGCDLYAPGIMVARHWFAELAEVQSKFEVVDLEQGPHSLITAFGFEGYDIVLFLGVLHKLKRTMPANLLWDLLRHIGEMSLGYLAWNGYADDLTVMDTALRAKFDRVLTSELAMPGQPAAIWKRR